ncbi:MAG: serine hydrolase, partial [Calditrichaeota bacterium]|nr:serine hydrolase [Calditrichota bacterium]
MKKLLRFRFSKSAVLLFVIFFGLSFLSAKDGQTVFGHWEGKIELPGSPLDIDIDFSAANDKSIVGDISIPLQGAKDLPLAEIVVSGKEVTFKMTGVPGNPFFKGKISDDGRQISGQFTQSGQSFPFQIKRTETPSARVQKALDGFDDFVSKAIEEWNVPGVAIAVVSGDEVIFKKGFGFRDVKKKLPVTAKTLFAIGSSTKAFTTFVLGVLVDEGKFEWDKPVRNYIPDFRLYDLFASQKITPRDLVTHRSGLPRHDLLWYNNHKFSRKEIVRRLRYLEPNADLRAKYQYNNLMFLTAGYLVECLTNQTWEETVKRLVFDPLEMSHSNFSVLESQKTSDFALPYKEEDDKLKQISFRQIDLIGPAGSINSNAEDMSHWLIVHLNKGRFNNKQIINASTLADIHTPYMTTGATVKRPEISQPDYALGWFVDNYRGHKRIHHGGNIDGFTAFVTFFPNDGIGMVVLANKEGTPLPEILTRHAADRIFNLKPIDWNQEGLERRKKGKEAEKESKKTKKIARKKGTKPAHRLEEYAGDYEHPGYGLLSVRKVKDHLEFTFNDIKTPLEHWHYEVFNALKGEDDAFENMKLQFRTDLKGNVSAVEVPFEPSVKNIVFTKKPDSKMFDPEYLKQFIGDYDLAGRTISIDLVGNVLKLIVPGQPRYTLLPDLGNEFVLKEYSLLSIRFSFDEKGKVNALILDQPDGMTT